MLLRAFHAHLRAPTSSPYTVVAVSHDGYGVSYMVSGIESELFFHVTSRHSCPTTDSARFLQHIYSALSDMRAALEPVVQENEASGKARAVAGGGS